MKILLIDNGTKHLEELKALIPGAEITKKWKNIEQTDAQGYDLIVLSGSASTSVQWQHDEFTQETELLRTTQAPIVGICFGCELIAYAFGGTLKELPSIHEGLRDVTILDTELSHTKQVKVYEHHKWIIDQIPKDFIVSAISTDGPEAIHHVSRMIYGLQFHPENLTEGNEGHTVFENIIRSIQSHSTT